jgi:hypothetical protein
MTEQASVVEVSDKPEAPVTPADTTVMETPIAEAQPADAGTSDQPAIETPEFADKNMQAQFTKRMQEISAKEKELESAAVDGKKYNELIRNPRFVSYFKALKDDVPAEPEKFSITEDEWAQAQVDKDKYAELVMKAADFRLKGERKPLEERLSRTENALAEERLMRDITDFEEAKDDKSGQLTHPDFGKLFDAGKIEPYIKMLDGSKISNIEKLELGYRLAKSENIDAQITAKAHQAVAVKKQATGDKGSSADMPSKSMKKMSMREYMEAEVQKAGFSELP